MNKPILSPLIHGKSVSVGAKYLNPMRGFHTLEGHTDLM